MGADQLEPFCLAAVYDEEQRQPKIEHDDDEEEDLELIMEGNQTSSFSSGSTADLLDDASSSSSTSPSESNGALFNLSELMSHLPIKRGLSKFYQGKSQSFTSLARVTTLEDLAKSGSGGYGRRMKANKSCGGGLNLIYTHGHQQQRSIAATSPKATISKKYSSLSCLRGKINHNTLIVSKCNK